MPVPNTSLLATEQVGVYPYLSALLRRCFGVRGSNTPLSTELSSPSDFSIKHESVSLLTD